MLLDQSPTFVHLLDVEPDLAARLRDDDRAEAAQQLRMRVLDVPAGAWAADAGGPPRPLGFMVVSGLLLQEVRLASRSAMQLLGPGDVVLPGCAGGDLLDAEVRWSAAVGGRVAILDERILQACFSQWPGLGLGLVERTGAQLMRTATQAAIAQLPRVDQRLEAMFWDLADRWGHVTPSGIHLPLPLSHEVLARLVGGRRPTITLALRSLADRGIVARRPDRTWLLVAARPTLPSDGQIADAAPLPEPARLAVPVASRPWQTDARRDLLDTTTRIHAAHADQGNRHAANLRRYEEAREHSRQLREAIGRQRERRALRRVKP